MLYKNFLIKLFVVHRITVSLAVKYIALLHSMMNPFQMDNTR